MSNNALIGFMIQNIICQKFNIKVTNERLINTFKSNYDDRLKDYIYDVVNKTFDDIGLYPIECTTFCIDDKGKEVPYNFILSDNSTLSIRTNYSSDKVAPRKVGQAGFETLNKYFSHIYGKIIENQYDIKNLILNKTDEILPIFFEHLLDADYILWLYQDGTKFVPQLLKGNSSVNINYDKSNFHFTRYFNEWKESTTLKYKGKSIAEIQVHKNRSFKFRFIMKNTIPLITSNERTNETLGITAEKTICDLFGISYPSNFFKRYTPDLQYLLEDTIKDAFQYIPKATSYTGNLSGNRGGNSKCSYDFVLYGNKTLSLKTNINNMVCPPEIGQPNDKTCYLYFKDLIDEKFIDKNIFKKMVYGKINIMIKRYIEHLFDSDYLLRIYFDKELLLQTGIMYNYDIIKKDDLLNKEFNLSDFSFSKQSIDDWNESNTVYYNGISIGEFQIHNNRNCYKFRFNFSNLKKILISK